MSIEPDDNDGAHIVGPPVDMNAVLRDLSMTIEEINWGSRYQTRIIERLKPFKAEGHKGRGWTGTQAEQAARAEWESMTPAEHMAGFENDPEGAADESLSYWGDGA